MDTDQFIQLIIDQLDERARAVILAQHVEQLDDELGWALKEQADHYLRTDVNRSLEIADTLLQIAHFSGNPAHRALGLLARANAYAIGLGEYERALGDYDEAKDIFLADGDSKNAARSQIGKIGALTNLSRYQEAESAAQWAADILKKENELRLLAILTMNRAINFGRQGDDIRALETFNQAREMLLALQEEGEPYLPWVEQNRSIVLRNLGRLHESLEAAGKAWRGMEAQGEFVEAARARQSKAITYLLLGRYNEALNLMGEARRIFLADDRQRDALLLDVFLCDCLLPLRRFEDVIAITNNVRPFFAQRGMEQEIGKALLDEAVAYAGLGKFEEAQASLIEARRHFVRDANPVLVATADLELAALLLHLNEYEQSEALLVHAEEVFHTRDLTPQLAQVWLLKAQIALKRDKWIDAERLTRRALEIAQSEQIITLSFRARHLLGQILAHRREYWWAMDQYERAIQHLERLHGHLMTEFQADFLVDKTEIYEDAVLLALQIGADQKALELAERSKSRSLLSMIANRIDLSLQTRSDEDQAIVDELTRLRKERDRILLRWETGEDVRAGKDIKEARHRIWQLEQQITKLWHQLLIHNADYAQDAALSQVRAESPQPWLDEDTLLLEYFIARDQLVAFLIDHRSVLAIPLKAKPADIRKLLGMLALNNRTLPWAPRERQHLLARNAQGLLLKLYRSLIHPIADHIQHYARLIITPHGNLHYLPFHALFDGERYLIETHEVSYLPASSLLRFCIRPRASHEERILSYGFSNHGLLPKAVEEARMVADIMHGHAFIEDEATIARVKESAPHAQILHFASHGEFRTENPLFSGILLADGWLTALDIFNLRLETSLVTLSACETGQHRIGGGDELIGLTRSFLYAGAASLLLSYWQIPDAIAYDFIHDFYQQLAAGKRKATALRHAQLALLNRGREERTSTQHYQHPFIWASFFLMGSPHQL